MQTLFYEPRRNKVMVDLVRTRAKNLNWKCPRHSPLPTPALAYVRDVVDVMKNRQFAKLFLESVKHYISERQHSTLSLDSAWTERSTVKARCVTHSPAVLLSTDRLCWGDMLSWLCRKPILEPLGVHEGTRAT